MEPTAYSVRSYVASASGSGSYLALGLSPRPGAWLEILGVGMPETSLSRIEKSKVKTAIESILGAMLILNSRRKDWLVSRDRTLSVFVTFSRSDQLFYDISPADLNLWQSYSQAFIVFVMGRHREVLVIPIDQLQAIVANLEPRGYGEFKLHLVPQSTGYRFHEAPWTDLSHFHNNYSLLKM